MNNSCLIPYQKSKTADWQVCGEDEIKVKMKQKSSHATDTSGFHAKLESTEKTVVCSVT